MNRQVRKLRELGMGYSARPVRADGNTVAVHWGHVADALVSPIGIRLLEISPDRSAESSRGFSAAADAVFKMRFRPGKWSVCATVHGADADECAGVGENAQQAAVDLLGLLGAV